MKYCPLIASPFHLSPPSIAHILYIASSTVTPGRTRRSRRSARRQSCTVTCSRDWIDRDLKNGPPGIA
jgi:hypothetical protein